MWRVPELTISFLCPVWRHIHFFNTYIFYYFIFFYQVKTFYMKVNCLSENIITSFNFLGNDWRNIVKNFIEKCRFIPYESNDFFNFEAKYIYKRNKILPLLICGLKSMHIQRYKALIHPFWQWHYWKIKHTNIHIYNNDIRIKFVAKQMIKRKWKNK